MKPEIIYEDEDILAINKPAGLVVHSDGRTEEPSLAKWFEEKYPQAKDVGEPIRLATGKVISRPGIVHRIDRDTSGVLLLAKTDKGHEVLKSQFQNRKIEKIYHVFVYGLVKDDRGTIDRPIGRSSSDFRKWTAERGTRGILREAVTYFEVLKRDEGEKVTFLEVKPKTGRTHQIRVHLKAVNHPVVADPLYASKRPKLLGFERTALHARSIKFTNTEKEEIVLKAPYPNDFKQAIDKLGLSVVD